MKMKNHPVSIFLLLSFLLVLILPHSSLADKKIPAADLVKDGQKIDLSQEKYQLLFQDLTRDKTFTQPELDNLFKDVRIKRKVLVFMDTQWEAKPYYEYRPRFITRSVIRKAKKKLKQHKTILDRIEQEFGVNREVIIAIWGIESRFGKNSGGLNVFRTLNTLFDAYPRRSDFFRKQLIAFLILCKENNYDPLSIKGSYAGAFGQTQFIPSSFREYAVSFDGDDRRDVFESTPDILASIANYLQRFHWTLNAPLYVDIGKKLKGPALIKANSLGRKGLVDHLIVQKEQSIALPTPPKNRPLTIVGLEIAPKKGGGKRFVAGYPNFQAITEWNHSNRYAMAVSELAEAIK